MSSLMVWKHSTGFHDLGGVPRRSLGDLLAPNLTGIEEFKPDYITARDVFPATPRRVIGRYRLGTAEAELGFTHGGEDHELSIRCTNIAHAQKLYELIRAGKIWPTVSYEEEQSSKPISKAHAILREVKQFLVRFDRRWRLGIRSN